jgi:hypothetical protein
VSAQLLPARLLVSKERLKKPQLFSDSFDIDAVTKNSFLEVYLLISFQAQSFLLHSKPDYQIFQTSSSLVYPPYFLNMLRQQPFLIRRPAEVYLTSIFLGLLKFEWVIGNKN